MRRVFRIPFSRSRLAREIDDELAFHFQMRVDQLVARGLTPDAARRDALRQFGALDPVREQMLMLDQQREATTRRANMFSDIRQDIAYGIRTLRRNVGFTTLVVGGLALGIGANAAIYSLIDAVLLRTLPVPHAEQLVAIGDASRVGGFSEGTPRTDLYSVPLYLNIRNAPVFQGVLATGRPDRLDLRVNGAAGELEHPRGRYVSSNYFTVLGLRPAQGRTFAPTNDAVAGGDPEVVISYGYWTRRFQNDPSAIGRTITINNVPLVIAGVAPRDYDGEIVGTSLDLWIPLTMHDVLEPHRRVMDDRTESWLILVGRLAPGATLETAKQQLVPLIRRMIVEHSPPGNSRVSDARKLECPMSSAAKGLSRVRADFGAPLLALMVGVALLLAIVCANVANLLLARGIARRKEMSLRLAIGANRARIVRQLLTESLLLALASGAAAVLVAWWASRTLLAMASDGSHITLAIGPNASVLAFTLALSVASVLLFGLVPALRASRIDLATTMRATSRSVSHGARFGWLLITAQVALSLVLLAGASMLSRSLHRLQSTDLGFDRDHMIVAVLDTRTPGYDGYQLAALAHALRDRVSRVPGVAAVSYSENGLFSGTESGTSIEVPGFTVRTPDDSNVAYDNAGEGYAHAIGARLLAGRDLDTRDENVLARTALVNETFARFYYGSRPAVGQFFHLNDSVAVQIVGVISDVRGQSLDTPQGDAARRIYFPYLHASDVNIDQPGALRLLVRSSGDPGAVVQQVRRAITSVDPTLPIDGITPVTQSIRVSIREERLVTHIATALGALALLLAAIGLYGVVSYSIARRTNEIGVRIALGAQRANIARMVVRDALRPVVVGLVIGTPLAIGAMRLLQAKLSDAGPIDPPSIAIAYLVLAASAVAAAFGPARRATRIDPIQALREE